MKKILFMLSMLILLFIGFDAQAEEVHVYLFYGNTCPICESLREYLEKYKDDKDVVIHEFEVYENDSNLKKMSEVKSMYNQDKDGVPFLIIGDNAILGFNDSRKTRIDKYISRYKQEDYYDRVGVYLGLYEDVELDDEDSTVNSINTNQNVELDSSKTFSWKLVVMIISIAVLVVIFSYQFISTKKIKL